MQAEGKKRMKALGKVEVPQEAFMAGMCLGHLLHSSMLWQQAATDSTPMSLNCIHIHCRCHLLVRYAVLKIDRDSEE
jgi:hypothetical protein